MRTAPGLCFLGQALPVDQRTDQRVVPFAVGRSGWGHGKRNADCTMFGGQIIVELDDGAERTLVVPAQRRSRYRSDTVTEWR